MRAPRTSRTVRDEPRVKVTLRLRSGPAALLADRAGAAGVSRGDYFASVLAGTPVPPLPPGHAQCLEAVGLSNDGLAAIARDIKELLRLRDDPSFAANVDTFVRWTNVDSSVMEHLRTASEVLSELRADAARRSNALRGHEPSPEE